MKVITLIIFFGLLVGCGGSSPKPPVTPPPPALTITTVSLVGAKYNTPYFSLLAATGGVAPYTWTLIGGQLPEGMSLSESGGLSGTPTQTGTFTFVVEVTDSSQVSQVITTVANITGG